MRFEGIYVPVITPFCDDHSIDKDGLAKVIDWLITAGVHGIIVGGTTGEYYAQTRKERVELMRLGFDAIGGRVPMMVGVGAIRTEDSVYFAEQAARVGANALLVTSPPYALPTAHENALHALAIDKAANLPAMLYNYPDRMGARMDQEYLDAVGKSSNFCAIKESSGDINRLHLLACDYPNLQVSCGADSQALEFFVWGARSWVAAGANFAPEVHIALWQACVIDGDYDKGRRIMSAMMPLMWELDAGGVFMQCVKHALSLRGLPSGPVRLPMQPLDEKRKRKWGETIKAMDDKIAAIMG